MTVTKSEITVSYSELSKFRQCPHSHDLSYMQRWTRPNEQGSPLHKGTCWHQTLEAHYRALKEGKDAMAAGRAQIRDFIALGVSPEVTDLMTWMYDGYLHRYSMDPSWEILEVEHKFETPLRTKAGRRSGFRLKGGVDVLARNKLTGKIWVWDHKCLDSDTSVETFSGTNRLGDVKAGELVLGSDGSWTEVLRVSHSVQPCYRIKLRNGSSVVSSADHVWPAYRSTGHAGRWHDLKEFTTQELIDGVSAGGQYRLAPAPRADRPDREFSLHPYVLGALLGDGSLSGTIRFHRSHEPTVERLSALLPADGYIGAVSHRGGKSVTHNLNGLASVIRSLGLYGVHGRDKFIPEKYFMGSFGQRLELLRGLMDSDGSHRKGVPLYQTGSKQLADDVCRLVRSLGGVPTLWCNRRPKYQNGIGAPCWDVKMRFPQGFPIPYHHEDKAARWKPGKAFLEERLNIESIEFVGDRQCTDLAVAADDQLFAANGVLTHNSASTLPKDRDLGLDQQLWLYGWAMRQLGVPVYGAIYSVSRTYQTKTKVQTLDERFNRILVAFEDDVLETTATDALSTVRSAYSKFNQKERHPDPEMCKRRCGFYDACLVGRSQGDAAERAFLVNTGHRVDFTRH